MGTTARWRTGLVALFVATALALVACGGDDDSGGETATGDEAEITETIRGWLTEGGCERMTDSFLEDQTFNDDPEEACETFESTFTEPSYSAEDINVSDIQIDGDKASAVISDDISNVTATYNLVLEDGTWKIDSVDL